MTDSGQASRPDIIADLRPVRVGSNVTCDIARMRVARPDLAEQYDRAMADGRFSDRDIARWITSHGYVLAHYTVGRHKRLECRTCQISSAT